MEEDLCEFETTVRKLTLAEPDEPEAVAAVPGECKRMHVFSLPEVTGELLSAPPVGGMTVGLSAPPTVGVIEPADTVEPGLTLQSRLTHFHMALQAYSRAVS